MLAMLQIPFALIGLVFYSSLDSIHFEPVHLFSLNADKAEILYRKRPTPSIAIDSHGNIAFPTRENIISIFSENGNIIKTIHDSTLIYPKKMLFDENDILQVSDLDEKRIIKYFSDRKEEYPFNEPIDWWRYSDKRISQYLSEFQPLYYHDELYDPNDPAWTSLTRFNKSIDIFLNNNKIYANGKDLIIYDCGTQKQFKICKHVGIIPEGIIGILNDQFVVVSYIISNTDSANEPGPYVLNINNGLNKVVKLSGIMYKYKLPKGPNGNGQETNLFNEVEDCYWQRQTNNFYRVVQLPAGFEFIKITIN